MRGERPVGRVLCARLRGAAVIHLGLPLPAASCGLPASIGRAALDRSRREPLAPLLTLLRVGFTEPPQSPAALVVSYTTVSPLPRLTPGRFAFCGTVPRVTRVGVTDHPALWSPDLPHRACARRDRPADSPVLRIRRMPPGPPSEPIRRRRTRPAIRSPPSREHPPSTRPNPPRLPPRVGVVARFSTLVRSARAGSQRQCAPRYMSDSWCDEVRREPSKAKDRRISLLFNLSACRFLVLVSVRLTVLPTSWQVPGGGSSILAGGRGRVCRVSARWRGRAASGGCSGTRGGRGRGSGGRAGRAAARAAGCRRRGRGQGGAGRSRR